MQYSKDTIDKIGNAMIYLSKDNSYGVSKTKMLKMLYILEELSVLHYKVPFFGVPFEVWKFGPVYKDLYIDTAEGTPNLFKKYIQTEYKKGSTFIKSASDFSDDEFSDNDLKILEKVKNELSHLKAEDLVELTHKDGSPWAIAVKENNLEGNFDNGICASDVNIDFSRLLEDECDKMYYNAICEDKQLIESLK